MSLKFIYASLLVIGLASCGGSDSSPPEEKQSLFLTYDFSESTEGFSVDTADYDVEHQLNYLIISEHAQLPEPFEYRKGIKFSWLNYSDDMKGFIKRKITELNKNSQFLIDFKVAVLSSISEFCGGAGGSPGSTVRVKAALLTDEPKKFIDYGTGFPMYRIDIDDGQSGGDDVVLMGNIGLPIECTQEHIDNPIWEIKSLTNDENFIFTTNSEGEAWIYVSIDSGSEGPSTFYLTEVELQIQEL